MAEIVLQLGTNLGDRKANLARALELLDNALGPYESISQVIETEAVGFSGPAFLNCAVRYRTRKRPLTVLGICKDIEYAMGRRETMEFAPDGSRIFHDRIIDIDILVWQTASGPLEMHTEKLTLPHPQVEERPFVKPLMEQVLTKEPR